MKRNRPVYPIQTSSTVHDGGNKIMNEVVGGLTVRDYIAVEFAAAMFSNPILPQMGFNDEKVRAAAIQQAEKFIEMLGED